MFKFMIISLVSDMTKMHVLRALAHSNVIHAVRPRLATCEVIEVIRQTTFDALRHSVADLPSLTTSSRQ